ncbi:MAG: hypothetical protein JSS15_09370 [Proteobacteria bacterium]|nr:hypothetical protein [Pseudomonadota bacterium]
MRAELVEDAGEAVRIGRIGTVAPRPANGLALRCRKLEQPRACPPPDSRAFVAKPLLLLGPPSRAVRHLLVDAMLAGRDHVGEQRQRLALAPLFGDEGSALGRAQPARPELPAGGWFSRTGAQLLRADIGALLMMVG